MEVEGFFPADYKGLIWLITVSLSLSLKFVILRRRTGEVISSQDFPEPQSKDLLEPSSG
jgi:hypothetical protein